MSQYYQIWDKLSKKIKALYATVEARSNLLQNNSSDAYDSMKTIAQYANNCYKNIESYKTDFKQHLPYGVLVLMENFLCSNKSKFSGICNDDNMVKDQRNQLIISAIIELCLLEAEISYLLTDTQEYIRKSVEFAFAYLKRLIMANKSVRNIWQENWDDEREEHFERLGGEHLLTQKIWAFKANSDKERTDLILKESINIQDPLYTSAEGLVLTEWKKVVDPKETTSLIEKAKKQASRYRSGSLAPLELSNYCYLIMVSKEELEIKNQIIVEKDTTYRVV